MRGFGRLLFCLGVTGGLWAQGVRPPVRRVPAPRPVREGCPAVVPPSDSSTVATAADFIELKRMAVRRVVRLIRCGLVGMGGWRGWGRGLWR